MSVGSNVYVQVINILLSRSRNIPPAGNEDRNKILTTKRPSAPNNPLIQKRTVLVTRK